MRDGGIGEHRGQRNKQGEGDKVWRDWRTKGTKKQAWMGGWGMRDGGIREHRGPKKGRTGGTWRFRGLKDAWTGGLR